jgi:hypothetical protein
MSSDLRLARDSDNNLDLTYPMNYLNAEQTIAQRLMVKLGIWKGEPLFDVEAGFPWMSILGPGVIRPPTTVIASILQQQAMETPGIVSAKASASISGSALTMTLEATFSTGRTVTLQLRPDPIFGGIAAPWMRIVGGDGLFLW